MVGEGADSVRAEIARLEADPVSAAPLLPLSGGGHVCIVDTYRRLGFQDNACRIISAELRARAKAAAAAHSSLSRRLLARKEIPMATRCNVAAACVTLQIVLFGWVLAGAHEGSAITPCVLQAAACCCWRGGPSGSWRVAGGQCSGCEAHRNGTG